MDVVKDICVWLKFRLKEAIINGFYGVAILIRMQLRGHTFLCKYQNHQCIIGSLWLPMTSLNTNNKRLGLEILTWVFELGFLLKCSYLLGMPSEIDKLN